MTTHHRLTAEGLSLGYGDRTVVDSLDLSVPPGRITVIVGANACGKSTLLRSMSRLLAPRSGRVVLDGKEVHRLPAKELARTLGLLPQSPVAPEGITVSTSSAAAATRTRGSSPAGTRRTTPPWPPPWSHPHRTARRTRRGRTLRRPAPARVDRHGARPADRPAAPRRADRLPRRQPPDRGPRPPHRPEPLARHHHRDGPPRPQPRRPVRRPPDRALADGASTPLGTPGRGADRGDRPGGLRPRQPHHRGPCLRAAPDAPIGRHHVLGSGATPVPQEPSSAEPYQSEASATPGSARSSRRPSWC